MSHWFAYRVYDKEIDQSPGRAILQGPFDSYELAKKAKLSFRGCDLQKTCIFEASSSNKAEDIAKNEVFSV